MKGWDVAVSVTALVFTVMLGGLALLVGVFSLAFLDHCPPETCSVDGVVTAVGVALGAAGLVGVVGVVTTLVRLARRRTAWPFAIGTLVMCMLTCMAGVVGYAAAVGA
ncbi:hypothetical protein [Rhodococcoides fascians]|uniref:hypothetical protein n=1 Tax=Rhodococcoides fascians TaxID=1828 RepID=UPI00056133D5|nr:MULTISPECIES: hypothetical protein [Rhodococcus]OZE99314.1 hypothetical protein CH301_14175 [Rhodococcus sp. 15-1189-1-1a]OZF13608.1 hypothetical protein CH299_13955 [Rhodococcus sp. 14-2686-1-2]